MPGIAGCEYLSADTEGGPCYYRRRTAAAAALHMHEGAWPEGRRRGCHWLQDRWRAEYESLPIRRSGHEGILETHGKRRA